MSHRGVGIGKRGDNVVVRQSAHSCQRSQGKSTSNRVGRGEARTSHGFVALVAGDDQLPPELVRAHFFNRLVRVITVHAVPNPITVAAMAPTHTARTLLATTDHSRRHHCERLAIGARCSLISNPVGARHGRRARAGSAVALAGFRHPVAIKATMASPAIQPAAVVTSVMFTQEEMVPEPTPMVRAPDPRHRLWALPMAVVGLLTAAAPLALSFVPSSAVISKNPCRKYDTASPPKCVRRPFEPVEFGLVPADAEAVEPRLSITGAPTFDTTGQIYFVTITQPSISLLDWFVTRDNGAARFLSYRDKYGDQSEQQLIQSGQRQMRSAKDNAVYLALKTAGYPVTLTDGDVIVDFLVCLKANAAGTECVEYSPADKLLDPLDVLKEVDGKKITIIDDLAAIMAEVKANAKVTVKFERDGVAMSGEVETINAPGEDPPRTIIGFRPIDTTVVELPDGLNVAIDTETIGGPSAGLAFTLTLIDELTAGDLMGGKRIAVTGTIDVEGNVGAIGGLNSKASAVKQVGVRYFLVPLNQGDDGIDGIKQARKVVGDDVEIVPVATLQEALDALVRLGGDPVVPVKVPSNG